MLSFEPASVARMPDGDSSWSAPYHGFHMNDSHYKMPKNHHFLLKSYVLLLRCEEMVPLPRSFPSPQSPTNPIVIRGTRVMARASASCGSFIMCTPRASCRFDPTDRGRRRTPFTPSFVRVNSELLLILICVALNGHWTRRFFMHRCRVLGA